jgi:phosphopantothenoylcysteine decarboxylase/phosphopantothenate--cysteine ligase
MKAPVFIAPAMDLDMYRHPSTMRNLELLKSYGNHIIEPVSGELASGLEGKGRMEEPERIIAKLESFFSAQLDLKDRKVLITAGPTYEKIDPVRFIGNYSSGKMAYALAEACANRGAQVELISGPVSLQTMHPAIHRTEIESAAEMYEACMRYFPTSDVTVLCAAVADFSPENPHPSKIKSNKEGIKLTLKPTKDIAFNLGNVKKPGQILVGFALETDNEIENAQAKLERKKLDFIVLNSLNDKGAGFKGDTNKIKILEPKGKVLEFPLKSKQKVAEDIVNHLITKL